MRNGPAVVGALILASACGGDSPLSARALRAMDRERWYVPQNGIAWSCPVVVDSLVVFPAGNTAFVARDRRTGATRWTARIPPTTLGASPFVVGRVVVAPAAFETRGLDVASGAVLWRYEAPPDTLYPHGPPAPGFIAGNHLAADSLGAVYIPAWGGTVSAVDGATGAVRWIWAVDPTWPFYSIAAGVAIAGDTVFATVSQNLDELGVVSQGWLFLLDRASGSQIGEIELPFSPFGSAPVLWGDFVVIANGGGRMIALDRWTGRIAWDHQPPARHAGGRTPALVGSTLYLDGGDDMLYAVDAATGATRWRSPVFTSSLVPPRASARRVYIASPRRLYIFDTATGRLLLELQQRHGVYEHLSMMGCSTIVNGEVYIAANNAAWSFMEP